MINKAKTKPTAQAPDLLTTKTHFQILDGLRGVAAIAVVIYHFMEIAVPDYINNFIAHGHLAVDFFFCLSGFVIAYAYDNRMAQIGSKRFFLLRLIRLQPLVVTGAVIGLLAFVFDPFHNMFAAYGVGKTLLMFLSSALMIPYTAVPERYNNLFHFNPPTWSLFWEYIANIFYALVLFKLRNTIMWMLTLIGAAGLCYAALHYGHLSVGWGAENFMGGVIRVFFSFLVGILAYRSNWIIKSSLPFPALGLLLAIAFFVPWVNNLNWIMDPLIVIFYFPFLVALGAGARLTLRYQKLCRLSGAISYPLYMVHYPFIWLFFSYVQAKKPDMNQMAIVISIAIPLLLALAYFVMVYLDVPICNYLKQKLIKSKTSFATR